MKKVVGYLAAFLVFAVTALVVGGVEGLYQGLLPNYSERALSNIESFSNIFGLVLCFWLARLTYKKVVGNPKDIEEEVS